MSRIALLQNHLTGDPVTTVLTAHRSVIVRNHVNLALTEPPEAEIPILHTLS